MRDDQRNGGAVFLIIVASIVGLMCLWGYAVKTNDLFHLNKPVVERIDNITFISDPNAEITDLYRVQVNNGVIEIYHNSENYKAVYKVVDSDSLEFLSPVGEIMRIRFVDYSKPESIEKTDYFTYAIKTFRGETYYDEQLKMILSSNNTTEIVLHNEEGR